MSYSFLSKSALGIQDNNIVATGSTSLNTLSVTGNAAIISTTQLPSSSNAISGIEASLNVSGDIHFANASKNTLYFKGVGISPPTFTNRSSGTKIVAFPAISATEADYALGIESGNIWFSTAATTTGFRWYGGTSLAASLSGTGSLNLTSGLSATGGAFSGIVNITNSTRLAGTSTTPTASSGALCIAGDLHLYNSSTSSQIVFSTAPYAAPTFTTRTSGSRIVLFPGISVNTVDWAIGIELNNLWFSTSSTSSGFKWYGGTSTAATLSGAGALTLTSSLTASAGTFSGAVSVGALTATTSITATNYQVYSGSLFSSGSGLFLSGAGASNYLSLKPDATALTQFIMTAATTALRRSDGTNTILVDNVTGGITFDSVLTIAASGTIQGVNQAEFAQLAKIDSTVISTTQWGYLGALNQNVHTTSSPTLAALTVSGAVSAASFTGNLIGGTLSATTGTFTGTVATGALSATGGSVQHLIQSNSSTDVLKIQNLSAAGYASLVFNTPSLSAFFGVGGSGTGVYANNIYLTGSTGTSFIIQQTVASVKVQNTTDASSATTGCFQASGGAGFGGSVHSAGMASRFGRNVNNLAASAPVEIACDINFNANQMGTGLRISNTGSVGNSVTNTTGTPYRCADFRLMSDSGGGFYGVLSTGIGQSITDSILFGGTVTMKVNTRIESTAEAALGGSGSLVTYGGAYIGRKAFVDGTLTITTISSRSSTGSAAGSMLDCWAGATVTDTTTAASTTNATIQRAYSLMGGQSLVAANTGVVYTNSATVYIGGPPVAGANVTLTNAYSLYVAGSSIFTGAVTVPTPTATTDAANKAYIDALGYLTAGTGLSKVGSTLSVNAAQTQITSVGTLSSLAVTGALSSGALTATTGTLTDTTDSSSSTSGSLVTNGGVGIAKNVYVNGMGSRFGLNLGNFTATAPVEIGCNAVYAGNQLATGLRVSNTGSASNNVSSTSSVSYNYVDLRVGSTSGGGFYGALSVGSGSTIIDALKIFIPSGSAAFSGAVTAPSFSGNLNGGTLSATTGSFSGAVTVPTPSATTHATTKAYVDGLTYLTAGTGLTLTGGTLSVNASQSQITSVGTLSSLTVTGALSSGAITATTGAFSGVMNVLNTTKLSTSSNTVSSSSGSSTIAGDLHLYHATNPQIVFFAGSTVAPSFTTRSAGTRLIMYPGVSASSTDYAIGMETANMWFSASSTTTGFKWYGGTTLAASLSGAGVLTLASGLNATTGSFTGAVSGTSFTGNLIGGTVSGTTGTFSSLVNIGANASLEAVDGQNGLMVTGGVQNNNRYLVLRPNTPASGGSLIQYTTGSYYITKSDGVGQSMYIDNNTGNVTIDDLTVTRNIQGVTPAEFAQLANINSVAISNTQWTYLGNMNQSVSQTSSVTFQNILLAETTSNAASAVRKDYVDGLSYVGTLTSLAVTGALSSGALSATTGTFTGAVTVPTPTATTDAANKAYVDALGYLTAGTGLTKSAGTISVNPTQSQITSVGTLGSLNVSGDSTMAQVVTSKIKAYGGLNQIIVGNSAVAGGESSIAFLANTNGTFGTGVQTGWAVGNGVGNMGQGNFSIYGTGLPGNAFSIQYADNSIKHHSSTDSSSPTTGGTQILGGLGVAKNVNVGGTIAGTTGSFSGTITSSANSSQLYFSNTTTWGEPTLTTRSAGTRIVILPSLTSVNSDFALGVGSYSDLWFSSVRRFRWYQNASMAMELTDGSLALTNGISATSIQIPNGTGLFRTAASTADYSLIGSNLTDGTSNSRIVISGNTRVGYLGAIEYITTNTGDHRFYLAGSSTPSATIGSTGITAAAFSGNVVGGTISGTTGTFSGAVTIGGSLSALTPAFNGDALLWKSAAGSGKTFVSQTFETSSYGMVISGGLEQSVGPCAKIEMKATSTILPLITIDALKVTFQQTANSTSTTTGAVVFAGGVGIQGALYGTASTFSGTVAASVFSGGTLSATTGSFSSTTRLANTSNTLSSSSGALTVNGDIHLYNAATPSQVVFSTGTFGAPTFTTRSAGSRIVMYPGLSASTVDWGLGVESNNLWFSTSSTSTGFRWYGGTTLAASLSGTGALTLTGGLTATTGTFTGAVFTGNLQGVNLQATGNLISNNSIQGGPNGFLISPQGTFSNIGLLIYGGGECRCTSTTPSNSTTSGALTVLGGVGIQGALYGTASTFSGTVAASAFSGGTLSATTGSFSGTITSTANSSQIYFSNTTTWGEPTLNTRSVGTRIVIYPSLSPSTESDYALGIGSLHDLWFSSTQRFRWYQNAINVMDLTDGSLTLTGGTVKSSGVIPLADAVSDVGTSALRWRTLYASNGVLQTSDLRLKSNIVDIPSSLGLSFVNSLKPATFNLNTDLDGKRHMGLIAQDVEVIINKIGQTALALLDKDETSGRYSMNYMQLLAPLVKAIQELSARVVSLEEKVKRSN